MNSISLCMIVKNEEDVLDRCLSSVRDIVDEIVIVDTGSTDNTKGIANKYTDKVFDFQWINDFSAARNYSFSKATKDYILWLDADDVILKEDIEKFLKLKGSLNENVDVVMMKYNTGFDEDGKVTFSYFRERLSKRINSNKWREPVHEYLEIGGNIIYSDVCITHKKEHVSVPGRNLAIYKSLLSKGRQLSPRGLFYYARELFQSEKYDDAIKYFNKFLNSEKGWIEDNINACFNLSVCYDVKNDKKNMLKILLKSFEYDTPRADICCQLGYFYLKNREYEKAIFWYKLASNIKPAPNSLGFISHDYFGYIPNIQLCVCYDKLGNLQEAIKHNEKAAEFKPNDGAVAHNREYFKSISKKD